MSAPLPGRSPFEIGPAPLEVDVPLSQSLIWRLQGEMYSRRGLAAWTEDSTPYYITNNPFLAETYAQIVFGFYCDCLAAHDKDAPPPSPRHPLRILELGAGCGRFAFLFLRRLRALLEASGFATDSIRYCMSDCSDALLRAWRANSHLAALVDQGALEFEIVGVASEVGSNFLRGANSVRGPAVVIANYVFDSLPSDAFVIRDGNLLESLVTTTSAEQSAAPVLQLSSLKQSYRDNPVSLARYGDPVWNRILNSYREGLPNATALFPAGALGTLKVLSDLAGGRVLVLAADKGLTHEEDLQRCQGRPSIEFHGPNCFSQLVNFDAIAKYFALSGGAALVPDKHSTSLSICAFLKGSAQNDCPLTSKAYREAMDSFGVDDLFEILSWLNSHLEEISVPQILALLRLSHWDTVVLSRLFPVLARQLRSASAWRLDLRDAVFRTWANHFPLSGDDNVVAFQCGVIFLELGFFDDALSKFETSQKILGPSAATSYNVALCALGAGRSSDALQLAREASALDPTFEPARTLCVKLAGEGTSV